MSLLIILRWFFYCPTTLNCFFQASDDYYNRWGIVCFVRILRYGAALIAMGLPAFYIAIACFHPEMLPTSLELSFAAAREGVPFPLPVEVLLLELAFELLREAGIRLPGPMGSALGIVGGLIIGQAAVEGQYRQSDRGDYRGADGVVVLYDTE